MTWTALACRQLARVVCVVIAVAVIAMVLAEAAPGSAGERAARAAGVLPPDDSPAPAALREQLIDRVARDYDLERSLAVRIGSYIAGLPRLELGRSWRDGSPVRTRVGGALWPTLQLILLSLVLGIVVGIGAALASARRPGSAGDIALGAVAAVAIAVPPVWLAIAALRTFAAGDPWTWFPVEGFESVGAMVLPVFVLAAVPAMVISRHARAALITASKSGWASAARARGASTDRVLAVHALRVELPTLLPLVVVLSAYLLGATVVIERVFGIRGLGSLLLDASASGDAPVIVGCSVVAGLILALVSAAVEIAQRATDPRSRA